MLSLLLITGPPIVLCVFLIVTGVRLLGLILRLLGWLLRALLSPRRPKPEVGVKVSPMCEPYEPSPLPVKPVDVEVLGFRSLS